MISASPSGSANGGRLDSAKPAIMKIRKPTNCGMKYHMPAWPSTMSTSDSDWALMTTPTSAMPCAAS